MGASMSTSRIEDHVGAGFDYQDNIVYGTPVQPMKPTALTEEAEAAKKPPPPPPPKNNLEVLAAKTTYDKKLTGGAQGEKTYDMTGSLVTTAYNLRLEGLGVKGEEMEFTGDASGIFTVSACPLKRARLRTKDLLALRTRGTLFFFDFRPSRLEVRFYDPNNADAPLGVLYADPVPPAGSPGSGAGRWSTSF